jgi:hypothetical protein
LKPCRNITEFWGLGRRITTESKGVKKLLLAKDKYGIIAWHQAAELGSLKQVEILCSLGKGVELNLEELVLT